MILALQMKKILSLSIFLNLLFIIGSIMLGFYFKDRIHKYFQSKKHFDIMLYGDSLIEDFIWQPNDTKLKIANIGHGGITTSELVWYIKDEVALKGPKICFLEGGINDLTNGIPIERTIENYSTMIDTLADKNIKPVIMGTVLTRGYSKFATDLTLTNQYIDSLDVLLEQLAKTKPTCTYLNINTKMSEDGHLKNSFTDDGIHLNKAGYKAWSVIIEEYLKKNNF